ncbi:hypothetical protein [Streptomyces sp. NPDC101115]|uniref:hypothetical protein n=1 Tax=Streptomyces sp. NPDC101115 TaxID=3366106 RepID=UPI00382BB2F8
MSITVPTNIPSGERRTIRVEFTAPLPPVPVALVLVDCNGNVWREAGVTESGERRMVCDLPVNPEDRGEGPSFPWTLRMVEGWFGPVRPLGGAA